MWVPCEAGVTGLFLQPPAVVLSTPSGLIICTAFGDHDVFVRPVQHDHHMASGGIAVSNQVAWADVLPTWVVDPPPWEGAEGGIAAQSCPACAVVGRHTVGAVAVGAEKLAVHSAGGVDVPERPDGRLDACLRERGRGLLLIGSVGVNVNAVGGGVVGHAEVHSLRNVPEFHEVVVVDTRRCG